MPTVFNGKKVLLLGSGGLRIGQAGEFDYSGSQAIKALKEEGIKVVLANPNIATVQTDAHMADVLYLQPLNKDVIAQIIKKEKPEGILLGFGGQTALNLGLALEASNLLQDHQVAVLGTQVDSIRQTEDRDLFKSALESIHIKSPRSVCVSNVEDALSAAEQIGYPLMVRAGFSLGGLGSGKITHPQELIKRAKECFAMVSQILIEEYLLGWKEFEYEIVRDREGNTLTICNMENLDPMGIHTGESIVIAPAQTLSNRDHQHLRNMAIRIANHFKIIGECNIQFAVNPENGDYRVIEMNARLSRSSALASKATGYPLAFIAAKLGLGYLLHEIKNSVTQKTCAFFEPALDYVVVKIPRWDTHKLKTAERTIGTEMKSVGEVMGIGRSFPESLQKAVGMLNIGASCLSDYPRAIQDLRGEIEVPTDRRLFALYQFFLHSCHPECSEGSPDIEEAYQLSKIDPWFLMHIKSIAEVEKRLANSRANSPLTERELKARSESLHCSSDGTAPAVGRHIPVPHGLQDNASPPSEPLTLVPEVQGVSVQGFSVEGFDSGSTAPLVDFVSDAATSSDPEASPSFEALLLTAKKMGFSDRAIGRLVNQSEEDIRSLRLQVGIIPYVKQIDTLAGEFSAQTNYLYLTYHGCEHDIEPCEERPVLVLGSGPYSIGSSVEFDWCAVNTSRSLRESNKKAILINSNPETVSTDYDESDRLYFEQLTLERVRDIADFEQAMGIVVSVGGQVANNLALPLAKAGYQLLGTTAQAIDQAENREKFSALLNELNIDQPPWQRATSLENAKKFAEQMGYPVLFRPSYILSGSAMNVAYDENSLEQYLREASLVSADHPVVISKFIQDAKELEIDGVADNGRIIIEAITEHIENAGIHSGDATLVIPPQRLYLETIRKTKKITKQIVNALKITGPFNIQFIAQNNFIQVIECNLRASRSFPFVSKVTGYNFIAIATRAMLGTQKPMSYETLELDYVGVKVPQFSYQRLKGANPVANVEMASTGEVACLGDNLYEAYLNAWLATEQSFPEKRIFVSIADVHKLKLLPFLKQLDEQGWEFYSTSGTHNFLSKNGVGSYFVYKASEKREPNIQTLVGQHKIDMIINIPTANGINKHSDGYLMRRVAVDHSIPLITNLQIAQIMLQCLLDFKGKPRSSILSWQEYLQRA